MRKSERVERREKEEKKKTKHWIHPSCSTEIDDTTVLVS